MRLFVPKQETDKNRHRLFVLYMQPNIDDIPCRLLLCAKDIMAITGKSERTARRMIAAIKKQSPHTSAHGINIFQFCQYTGLRPEVLKPFL